MSMESTCPACKGFDIRFTVVTSTHHDQRVVSMRCGTCGERSEVVRLSPGDPRKGWEDVFPAWHTYVPDYAI